MDALQFCLAKRAQGVIYTTDRSQRIISHL